MRLQDTQVCLNKTFHIQSHQDKNSQVRKYDLRVGLEPSMEKENLTVKEPRSHCVHPHLPCGAALRMRQHSASTELSGTRSVRVCSRTPEIPIVSQ